MKKSLLLVLISLSAIVLASCYKNYYDVSNETLNSINHVSFRNDVVPIVTGGGCGCHNNENANSANPKQVSFSHEDTVYYSTIVSRGKILDSMARGLIEHPAEGGVYFTTSQANVIKNWIASGGEDDGSTDTNTGNITYSAYIVPIYKTDCKGGTCHGGSGPTLDYTTLKSFGSTLTTMMNSKGANGHPGGTITVVSSTASTFLAWIAQGYQP